MAHALYRQRWQCVVCNEEVFVASKAKHLATRKHLANVRNPQLYTSPPTNVETPSQKAERETMDNFDKLPKLDERDFETGPSSSLRQVNVMDLRLCPRGARVNSTSVHMQTFSLTFG